METTTARFLTAEWRDLVVLNFEIDPAALAPLVPRGTELDLWQNESLVSLVGFRFLRTRVLGLAIPFHCNFAEVNLRFYVRRKVAGGWRRAVVFVRELAPRRAIAWTARVLFGENYLTVPLRHHVEPVNGDPRALRRVAYAWRLAARDYSLEVRVNGRCRPFRPDSQEAFVIDHLWGCSGGPGRRTIEYRVEHPAWQMWPAHEAHFAGDAERLYGAAFAEALGAQPRSAFLVDGSAVNVFRGRRLE